MDRTLSAPRDRTGHGAIRAFLLVLIALLIAPRIAAAAGPGKYKAQRFDVAATVVEGNLEVAETIVFEFQTGVFKRVWREISTSRTDGIEILEARMDGTPLTRGDGPGHIAVTVGNRVKVEWQFSEIGASVHTFELRYLARGVAYREGDHDVVRWRLLPGEHRYAIDAMRATIAGPGGMLGTPVLESRKLSSVASEPTGGGVAVSARGIRENGWVTAEIRYPPGSVTATQPAWQARHDAADALAPRWQLGAAALFVVALIIILTIRQGYDSPEFESVEKVTATEPPDAVPAAIAAALASKGRAIGHQSVVTLLDLADRGVLTVRELPRRFGVRQYEIAQVPGKHDLADHEIEALTIAFAGSGDEVTMSKAHGRLARSARRFADALNNDLTERGLLDPSRKAVRDRLTAVSVAVLFTAGLGCVGVAALIPRYDGWPFLLPLGLALAGIVGVVLAAATTPLSDAGLMQSARWRGFKRYLKDAAEAGDGSDRAIRSRWVVYGMALGLAQQWSRYLKKHPGTAPPWFIAAPSEDAGGAFAAFVGSNAAAAGAGGAGGGAAAGGGSSGAG